MALSHDTDHLIRSIACGVLALGGAFTVLFPKRVRFWCYRIEIGKGKDKAEMREQVFNRWYNHPAAYIGLGLLALVLGLGMLLGYIDPTDAVREGVHHTGDPSGST
ncbi:MAG: hypothetical protein H0X38_09585 [Planctomycetes bacterium]|nr:hypothetical protein [Planctomycetota bacterium]